MAADNSEPVDPSGAKAVEICTGSDGAVTPQMINQRNRQFWAMMAPKVEGWIQDPTIAKIAFAQLHWEQMRGIPLKLQTSLEKALADAAEITRTVSDVATQSLTAELERAHKYAKEAPRKALRTFAQKGGRAPKADALQKTIDEIVCTEPNISCKELLKRLEVRAAGDDPVVIEVDDSVLLAGDMGMIHYSLRRGTEKTVPISGLKDRLFRAKKKTKSR